MILGIVVTAVLAGAASSESPPSVAQSALFALVTAILNVGGLWAFSRNPNAASLSASKMALRHLGHAGQNVEAARQRAEAGFEDPDTRSARATLGHLSVQLSALEQQLGSNLQDWLEAYPDLSPTRTPQAEKLIETKADDD